MERGTKRNKSWVSDDTSYLNNKYQRQKHSKCKLFNQQLLGARWLHALIGHIRRVVLLSVDNN